VSEFTVSVFTVDYTVWQECGWTGGQVRQPGGKPPSPQCVRPWALGQTRAPGACANLEASPLALGLPGLGRWGRPRVHIALWLPRPQAGRPSAAWHLISFLLGAVQALHGAWAAYTFSIIVLKIFFF
jgi:hypothetical protein